MVYSVSKNILKNIRSIRKVDEIREVGPPAGHLSGS